VAPARGGVDAALAYDAAARAAGRPEAANFEPIDKLRKAFLDNHPQPDRGQSPNAKTRKLAAAPAAACVGRTAEPAEGDAGSGAKTAADYMAWLEAELNAETSQTALNDGPPAIPALVEPSAKRATKETSEESLGQQRAAP
jgi:hypothetical protein